MLAAMQESSAGMITQRDLMEKYNLAAQLVSDTFANQLPNAMGYLGKVAAGTGEDMGYMLDSLVRGVGRLSPMILDNLGIQVDLASAYEAFAPTIGKTVGELSKQEQQTALMNQVMEKLAENTANMPEVMGTAAAGVAALGVQIKDLKAGIGLALQPALVALLTPLNDLAAKYGPKVIEWATIAGDWLGKNIPNAIRALETVWSTYWPQAQRILMDFWNAIKPALEWLRDTLRTFTETYLPRLRDAWDILKVGWGEIVTVFNAQLKPALQELWAALQPLWDSLGIGEGATFDAGEQLGAFAGVLTKLLASGVIEAIKGGIILLTAAVQGLIAVYELGVHWGIRIRDVIHSMIGVFENIRHLISVVVDSFNSFKNALSGFQLPWWLTPGSATPLETGLAGIGEALANVQGLALKGVSFGGGLALAGVGVGVGGGGGGGVTTITIVNRFGADSVRSTQDILDIADRITQNLELRGVGRENQMSKTVKDGGISLPGGSSFGIAGARFTSADQSGGVAAVTAAPTSGQYLVITDIFVSVETAMRVDFSVETTGTIHFSFYLPANGAMQITPRFKFKLPTADKKLMVRTSAEGNITVTVGYYSEA
jgi:hypothetical protein